MTNDGWLSDTRTPTAGSVVNDSVSTTANIAQSKVAGLVTDLASKAPTASPTFTGTVTVPTPAGSSNTTEASNTAWVQAKLASKADMTNPVVLNTLRLTDTSTANTQYSELQYKANDVQLKTTNKAIKLNPART